MAEPILLSEWLEASGCPRSTAYELIKLAAIEPGKARIPGSRRPVSELSGEQREQMDWLWAQRKAGTSKEELQRQILQAQGLDPDDLKPSADGLGTNPDESTDASSLAISGPQQAALGALVETVAAKAVAAAAANLKPARTAPDPLKTAKLLAEAALLDWLSRAEIARVLGLSQTSVDALEWPHRPRPGYRIERELIDGEPWFRVIRGASAPAAIGDGGAGSGGFFGLGRDITAATAIIPVQAVELPLLPR